MMKGGGYPFLLMVNADGTAQQQGQLVWGKRVEAHPAAMLTMSPTVHAGYIYQVRGSRTDRLQWPVDMHWRHPSRVVCARLLAQAHLLCVFNIVC